MTFFFALIVQCAPVSVQETRYRPSDIRKALDSSVRIPPSQEYAGEILSYLMQVVLGKEGNPKWREEWATRGFDEALDLGNIKDVMAESGRNKFALIVHDANILGLSEVLYHYDKNLNQFKGQSSFNSIYPSPELIAIRILLLKKIHQGKKVKFQHLFTQERLLIDSGSEPKPKALTAANLTLEELQLLREVIRTEPRFLTYMVHPFLVAALYRIGVIEMDKFVEKMIEKANYKQYPCRHLAGSQRKDAVMISVLPSMIKEFEYDDSFQSNYKYGFKPTDLYTRMLNRLKNMILERTKSLIEKENQCNNNGLTNISEKARDAFWEKIVTEKIAFYTQDQRPLVIYPGNEQQVIQEVCPETDFSVIILGKNVYLSLYFDENKDNYPRRNSIYLDIIDLKYNQVGEEIDRISRFIVSKLREDAGEKVR